MVEVLVASALTIVIATGSVTAIRQLTRSSTSNETRTSLNSMGQSVLNEIGNRLLVSKRVFFDSDPLLALLEDIETPVLTGSKLSQWDRFSSPSSPDGAKVGNSLFFARTGKTEKFDTTGACIEIFQFHYYYLAPDPATSKKIAGHPLLNLYEWSSLSYADYLQLMAIPNIAPDYLRDKTVQQLVARNITYAWDPSVEDATTAFYELDGVNGFITSIPSGSLLVQKKESRPLLTLKTGRAMGGFHYGVCPNTTFSVTQTLHTVPEFALASNDFPGGFEVASMGNSGAVQYYLRLVLAAEGSFSGTISKEQFRLVTVRNIW
ncbi:MAG: hypothetical protein KCHDKBKB_02729 [Elusimicrobia bacterium]|nr:hypothetical protein [Elusimicrobiota bacterium]